MDLEKSHSRIFVNTEGYHEILTPQHFNDLLLQLLLRTRSVKYHLWIEQLHSLNMEDQLKLHFSVAIETALF